MARLKFVKGYDDRYLVSDTGMVISAKRNCASKNGSIRIVPEKIIIQRLARGYYMANLNKDGLQKSIKVHRLVAEAFIPNPENKPSVNHKNGNKLDNNVYNLEWATYSENKRHAHDTGLVDYSKYKSERLLGGNPNAKKVINTITGKIYNSVKEAASVEGYEYGRLKRMLTLKVGNNSPLIFK